MPITQLELRPLYTTRIARIYNEQQQIAPKNFLRSFFPDLSVAARYPAIEVRRGSELIAIPVPRGHQGNMNISTKSTQKVIDPFYFREAFEATSLDIYFRLFGSDSFNENVAAEFINGIAAQNRINVDKIERAYEYMCSTILMDGTAKGIDGSQVDFGRKAESMVALDPGVYWTVDGTNPYTDMQAGCDFLRQVGKAMGTTFDVIMGRNAYIAFINNPVYKERQKYFNSRPDTMFVAQQSTTSAAYKGLIDCNTYNLRVWSYNDYYQTEVGGTMTPYIDEDKVVILPENPMFNTIFGAVPQLVNPGANTLSLVAQPYVFADYIDNKMFTHEFHVMSSGIPVPVAVDQIYTLGVVAPTA